MSDGRFRNEPVHGSRLYSYFPGAFNGKVVK